MVLREKFEEDLTELRKMLLDLVELTGAALEKAHFAFKEYDIEAALDVIDADMKIDKLEMEINDFAILLIAKQQPVAIDLRKIIMAIKVASDIERVADYSKNIAKATIRLGKEKRKLSVDTIDEMHNHCIQMIELFVEAYPAEDSAKAKSLAEIDDHVDKLYGETMKKVLQSSKSESSLNEITQISFIARHYERIADHITNMAENVMYVIKGKHYDLNE